MSNPFDALMTGSDGQLNGSAKTAAEDKQMIEEVVNRQAMQTFTERELKINELLVTIFRFVTNRNALNASKEAKTALRCVSLSDDNGQNQPLLSMDNFAQFLTDRIMLADVGKQMTECPIDKRLVGNAPKDCEQRLLFYLYECFTRIQAIESDVLATQQRILLRDTVINQSALCTSHPEFDPNHDPNGKSCQLLELLEEYGWDADPNSHLKSFISRVFDRIAAKQAAGDEEVTPEMALKPVYEAMCQRLTHTSLYDPTLNKTIDTLNFFVLNPNLSKALMSLNKTQNIDFRTIPLGVNAYQRTLFGLILSVSPLPRPHQQNFEFFLNPSSRSQQEHEITEKQLGSHIIKLTNGLHGIFEKLLRQKEIRPLVIEWIEDCLFAFKDRAKMWTNEMIMMTGNAQNPADGFMMNLSSILLQLCKPFCIPCTPKLLKVDARYCRLKQSGHKSYLEHIASEPYLKPSDQPISADKFEPNFMTQCFVATHKAWHLGFRVVHERFLKLAQELNQIQNFYREASAQSSDSEVTQRLRQRMDQQMTQFLALKTILCENEFIEMSINFHISTANWLNNLALNPNESEASKAFKEVKLPITRDFDSECLRSVPEFIMENVSDFITFIRRFSVKTFSVPLIDLNPLMSLVIIFMGSPERLKNPHLRAKLAETLESLMPLQEANPYEMQQLFAFSANTERLFTTHPLASELIPTLVHVFVSIEISESSGESVAFEQKFGYRRPMYIVLKYLWSNADHRKRMQELAVYAETNMEAINPPLFLRFINLLMNDAIFLLDEALGYMSKLRELQKQKESGEWQKLSAQQQQQNEANLQHTGRLAKFHNIIGRETINTLSWLTEEIKTIFSHKTLVDRMAAMLNYFLLHLVGPKKRNFKVKDLNQYDFKPAHIVHDICQIYVNLASQENPKFKKFCLAVGRDERSYSDQLLQLAADVLCKTGSGALSTETLQVRTAVDNMLQYQKRREINMDEVPNEFLDPIMSSLMHDPVILPSGNRVDRSTIARHLLSDQTDPFTRAPLTMDMVNSDVELKQKIKAWIEEQLKKRKEDEDKDKDTNN